MKYLLYLMRRSARLKVTPTAEEFEYAGVWMNLQLRQHFATAIMELEADIFDELDRLLYGPDGIGKRNLIAT